MTPALVIPSEREGSAVRKFAPKKQIPRSARNDKGPLGGARAADFCIELRDTTLEPFTTRALRHQKQNLAAGSFYHSSFMASIIWRAGLARLATSRMRPKVPVPKLVPGFAKAG